jgi:hypothetical protein
MSIDDLTVYLNRTYVEDYIFSFLVVTSILRDRFTSRYMESDGNAGNGCRNTLREDEETGETNKFVSEAVWGNSGNAKSATEDTSPALENMNTSMPTFMI